MDGYALGQDASFGLTEQATIVPGTADYPTPPAAGAEYTLTLTRYDRWRLVAVTFTLTTSATDVVRIPSIEYSGVSSTPAMRDPVGTTVPKSITSQRFSGALNIGSYAAPAGGDIAFPLSGLWLEAGSKVKLAVLNIDTTDALSAIRFTFDRWPVRAWESEEPEST